MERQFIIDTAKYVCTILRQEPAIVMSWGAERFRATLYNNMASLRFNVNGFLHKGDVVVAYNEGTDYFEIYCLDSDDSVVNTITDICFDELVDRIDKMVETKANNKHYHHQVEQWLTETEL